MKTSIYKTSQGFSLVEMMVAMTVGGIILAAVLVASVALQRSFAATESYSMSEGDQLRVEDYIAMDCRRATNAVVTPGPPQTLTLTLPNYNDGGPSFIPNPTAGASPAIVVKYGPNWSSTQISYYKSGNNFIRQVGTTATQCASGAAWTNCYKIIATNVNNFTVLDTDLTTTVRCSITFLPQFTTNDSTTAATTIYSNTFLRNPTAWH